jgi:hypothetical protein
MVKVGQFTYTTPPRVLTPSGGAGRFPRLEPHTWALESPKWDPHNGDQNSESQSAMPSPSPIALQIWLKHLKRYQRGWNTDQHGNIVYLFHGCTARLARHPPTRRLRHGCTTNGHRGAKNLGATLPTLATHYQSGSAEGDFVVRATSPRRRCC